MIEAVDYILTREQISAFAIGRPNYSDHVTTRIDVSGDASPEVIIADNSGVNLTHSKSTVIYYLVIFPEQIITNRL